MVNDTRLPQYYIGKGTIHPSNYYILDAVAVRHYFNAPTREDAQIISDNVYGAGKYKIRMVINNPNHVGVV